MNNELVLITAKYSNNKIALNPKMVVSIERRKTADISYEYLITLLGGEEYTIFENEYLKLVKYFPILELDEIKYE